MSAVKFIVKVFGPRGSGDEEVLGEQLLGSVAANWIERHGMTLADVWIFRLKGGPVLSPFRSFAEQGVTSESTIQIEAAGRELRKNSSARVDESLRVLLGRSVERLPERSSGVERLSGALSATLNHKKNAGDAGYAARLLNVNEGRVGRLKRAFESTNYQAKLEREIGRGRSKRCGVIAVVSADGGAGTSTVANLIASTLMAFRRDRVLLLDAAIGGGAVRKIVGPTAFSVDQAAERFAELDHVDRSTVNGFLSSIRNGLSVLPSADEQAPALIASKYSSVIHQLREHLGFIVIDCDGKLYDPATIEALNACDQVVLVCKQGPTSDYTTGQAVRDLELLGRPITVVVNRFPSSGRSIELAQAVGLAAQSRKLTIGILPESEEGSALIDNGSFTLDQCPLEWGDLVRELMTLLVGYWASEEIGVVSD